MRLVGSRSQHGVFQFYSCQTCHDALDLRLLGDSHREVAA
jgi:cytochrome c551/c552